MAWFEGMARDVRGLAAQAGLRLQEGDTVWDMLGRVLGALLALVLVLLCAWLVLRWVGGRLPGLSGGSARLIQVLDRISVGRGSTVLLVRVQDKVMLVAISEHAVEKLCEFDDPQRLIAPPEKPGDAVRFSDALRDAAKQWMNRGKGEK